MLRTFLICFVVIATQPAYAGEFVCKEVADSLFNGLNIGKFSRSPNSNEITNPLNRCGDKEFKSETYSLIHTWSAECWKKETNGKLGGHQAIQLFPKKSGEPPVMILLDENCKITKFKTGDARIGVSEREISLYACNTAGRFKSLCGRLSVFKATVKDSSAVDSTEADKAD